MVGLVAVPNTLNAVYAHLGGELQYAASRAWLFAGKAAEEVLLIALFAPVATAAILAVLGILFGLRVAEEGEIDGLDLTEHSESAYGFSGGGVVAPEAATLARPVAMTLIADPES